jgi:hypothetical protein
MCLVSIQKRVVALLSVLWFAACRPTPSLAGESDDATQRALLSGVKAMRAEVLGHERSGSGTVLLEGFSERYKQGTTLSGAPSRANFAFLGDGSIWREFDPNDAPKAPPHLLRALLTKSDKRYEFQDFAKYQPSYIPSVSVEAIDHNTSLLLEPAQWTLADLTRLPLWRDDAEFFDFVLSSTPEAFVWRAVRDGNYVQLTVDTVVSEKLKDLGRQSERFVISFDMTRGAMTKSYEYCSVDVRKGMRVTHREILTTSWLSQEAQIVPKERDVEITVDIDGKQTQDSKSRAVFESFLIRAEDASELSLASLPIPEGTVAIDRTTGGSMAKYFKGWGE